MEYMNIKQLSAKFAMPERTVYYHIANSPSIRVKKVWKSKLANVADFAIACGKDLQPLQNIANTELKPQSDWEIATLQSSLQALQTKHEIILVEKINLEKYNRNLEEIAQSRALALKDEKQEKLEWVAKYDTLQTKYNSEIQKFMKKYYMALWLCVISVIMLLILNLPSIVSFFQKIG